MLFRRWNRFSCSDGMTTELTNLPCGTVQVKVCVNRFCELGWVTSHHLVPTKEAQLKKAIREQKTMRIP